MKLSDGEIGKIYKVENTSLPPQIGKRLEALGMTLGTKVDIINLKNHGTMVIKLRGSRFAVGRGITSRIEVKEDF
ncbi:MAG: ferrous iron transport protein A [Anaerovoracaceae bacterium]